MHARGADAGEDAFEMITDQGPDGCWIQLLRSAIHPALKHCRDTHQRCPSFIEMGMKSGKRDCRLPGMFRPASHRGHQPGTTGNGLAPRFGIGQSDEETPPVVDQRHCPGGQLAAMQVMGGKTTPTPLILEFIEGILGIRSVTIELSEGKD